MKRFKDYIKEVLDSPQPYYKIQDTPERKIYNFKTPKNQSANVTFHSYPSNSPYYELSFTSPILWDLSFDVSNSVSITGENEQFTIFSTIKSITKEFIDSFKPSIISFIAFSNYPSKVRLYTSLLHILQKYTGFKSKIVKRDNNTTIEFLLYSQDVVNDKI